MSAARTTKLWAALPLGCATAIAALSCGSRTGLDVPGATTANTRDADAGDAANEEDAAPLPCIPGPVNLGKARPAVMFVIDRSGSMANRLGTGPTTRWQALTNALATTLPPVDATMEIGALLYPSGGSARTPTCNVPASPNLDPATSHVQPLIDLMRSSTPIGGTPTADALDTAAQRLLQFRAATTARTIVLATDGAPNCNTSLDPRSCRCVSPTCRAATTCLDDVRTVDRIRSFASKGLPTYVIGIQAAGDTQFSDVLDAMAVAGGRPQPAGGRRFYAAGSETDLTNALVTIREQVGKCTYLTTSVPSADGSIVVTLDGVEIPYDPTGVQGWTWGDKNNGEILLFGAACAKASAEQNPSIVANVSCDPPDASEGGASFDASDSSDAPSPEAAVDATPR